MIFSVTDSSIDSYLKHRITYEIDGLSRMWIGAKKVGGKWTWLDGSPFEYTQWGPNSPSGDGTCSEIWPDGWNDLSCTEHRRPFICHSKFLTLLYYISFLSHIEI